MKLFKKKSVTYSGSVLGKPRPFLKRIGRDPRVDWLLSVIASVIVAIVFATMGISKYLSYYSDVKEQVSSSKGKDSALIDTKSLDSVLGKYEDRDRLREELIRVYVGPSDPSL